MNSNSLSLAPPSSKPCNWIHDVFTSFHGADVRKSFLCHLIKEFRSKAINPFLDDKVKRGEFIGPLLKTAIQGSRIAIVLLSKNYASSSWCLDELAEIMKCKEEFGQIVMAIFYDVDPSNVKKHAGDFGEVFEKTCAGKTEEVIGRWKQVLSEVATIAGYNSINWENDAKMIEKIATEVSNKLIHSTPSRDFDSLIGMGAHIERMKPLLRLELDEVRMIGIWGPPGIGKTTIARFIFDQHSRSFDLSVFMSNIKAMYTIPVCSDDYDAKLYLQQKFMSQITNDKEIEITHLGAAQDRLNDKKVLVVLDDVDRSLQLDAMAKETWWFGHGSRIFITTQNLKLLKAHGINHIYKVNFPPDDEAIQILCMYAFSQKSLKDGFEELIWEVTALAGKLPLGLKVMGSYFRGMSKHEWKKALPSLRNNLHGDIKSVLMFSYSALCDEDKKLFLHIGCFNTYQRIEYLEDMLAKTFFDIRQGLHVLTEKSLIYIRNGYVHMHYLLEQLGREIVRKQSVSEPGKPQYLVDAREICEVLSDDTSGSSRVIGINLSLYNNIEDEWDISERAFERMSNLQFLKVTGVCDKLYFPPSLSSISRKLIYLDWALFPMTCLPSHFFPKFLVYLVMKCSKLVKLWDGVQPLRNLKEMYLSFSKNLKELPDLSTATNLKILNLYGCSSLVELPFSVGNATNLERLDLRGCSNLVDLPSSIGNAINLTYLCLVDCSSLVKLPSSIGNATKLKDLLLDRCSSLVELPFSIGNLHKVTRLLMVECSKLKVLPININMESLKEIDLTNCSLLKTFPEISTDIKLLKLTGTAVEEVPLAISLWSRLEKLHMSYRENLKDLPHALDSITELHLTNTEIQELGPWVKGFSRLSRLVVNGMQKLVSLPQLPDSLLFLDAENCESLERLDCPFRNPDISLNFGNCFRLNQDARDLIIKSSNSSAAVLPGEEVPDYFSDRATGGSLIVKLNERHLHTSLRFKTCIVMVDKVGGALHMFSVSYRITNKHNGLIVSCTPKYHSLPPALTGHLYTSELEAYVTSNELCFEFRLGCRRGWGRWAIKECGVLQLS